MSTSGDCGAQIPTLPRQELEEMLALWERGPHHAAASTGTYPFAEAATAHRRMLHQQNTGKIVLVP